MYPTKIMWALQKFLYFFFKGQYLATATDAVWPLLNGNSNKVRLIQTVPGSLWTRTWSVLGQIEKGSNLFISRIKIANIWEPSRKYEYICRMRSIFDPTLFNVNAFNFWWSNLLLMTRYKHATSSLCWLWGIFQRYTDTENVAVQRKSKNKRAMGSESCQDTARIIWGTITRIAQEIPIKLQQFIALQQENAI